jgi:hypothetical protein
MRLLLLLRVFAVMASCSKAEPLARELESNAPTIHPLHATQYSNIRDFRRIVIRDAATWAALWAEMINVGDAKTPPYVDFTREDVVVAAMGEKRVAGYAINIISIDYGAEAARIAVNSNVPGSSCDRAEVISAPLDAVRIKKLDTPAIFVETTSVRSCN